jgi:tetraprenyl-beta-curcumene synthase
VGAAQRRSSGGVRASGPLRALALANARYWPTVAPATSRELARWPGPAREIPDPALRQLALAKLAEERFNAEVAATLATLAPRAGRPETVRAIVALELLFDYLDGRTEPPCADPIGEGERLFAPFIAAVTAPAAGHEQVAEIDAGEAPADWGYLTALSKRTREGLFGLPAAGQVAATARACARRCAQAQTRIHAAATLGERQLQEWAVKHAEGSGLQWREYAAGCASSVLAIHALIAAAADPCTSEQDASRIDSAYLAICAAITILDSLVDRAEDRARGQPGFIGLYEEGELQEWLPVLVGEALARTREAPNADHHAMTLAGVAAYYTTHPGARDPAVRGIMLAVRRELSPTIWPTLAVMGGWRAAKRARAIARPRKLNVSGQPSDTRVTE